MSGTVEMDLPRGLAPGRVADFAALAGEIAGGAVPAEPWLGAALLFADPSVQDALGMPVPGPEELLVQDYQSLVRHAPLPCDTPLSASAARGAQGGEFDIALSGQGTRYADLKTALRLVPRRDLGAQKPTTLRAPRALGDLVRKTDLCVSQTQIDRYLALSGDANPIHRDPDLARTLGLPAPIVPGLLLVAAIQPLVPARSLATLTARFLAPITAGAAFAVSVQARGADRARAYLHAGGDRAVALVDLSFAG